MRLFNVRRGQEMVSADFTIADGRTGSVCIPIADYDAYGEAALEQEALACAAQRSRDGYVAPGRDRFDELG